ncbi:hypothetical protein CsSME_00000612 [Camellia sinensis var. sinensis]
MESERESAREPFSTEEADLLRRSKKKVKRRRDDVSMEEIEAQDTGVVEVNTVELKGIEYGPRDTQGFSFREALTNDNTKRWYTGDSEDGELVDSVDVDGDSAGSTSPWPRLSVPPDELVKLRAPWCKVLIVKVLGRTVGVSLLTQRMKQVWRLQQHFDMVDVREGYYLIRFACKADYLLLATHFVLSQ